MPEAVMAAEGTVLAFDFGTKRIGVAVGEMLIGQAHALTHIAGEESGPRFAAIAGLIDEWKPQRLVVGLPLSVDGTPHDLTRRAERFARQLEGRFGLPVSLVDERYTSVEAESTLRAAGAQRALREKKVDAAAAQLILQQYFHEHAA
jgi:putative Holliday junction resolvase